MKKNDYNLKVLRYMRGIKESKFLVERQSDRERKRNKKKKEISYFYFFSISKDFFAHFFQHKFPFRSCVGEVFDQYSHNFLFLLLAMLLLPFSFFMLVQYFFSLTIYSIAFTNILYRMRWLN